MSAVLGELTARAYSLVEIGDLPSAQLLLADALAQVDTDPRHASPALADAAGLHSRVLIRLGEPHSARGWAQFAYVAANRLYGPGHEQTIQAAATLATVLQRLDHFSESSHLYAEVIEGLTALQGPESRQVLAAHADLATVEYARGDCDTARARIAEAWDMTREAYGDADPAGIKMLARLGAMERDCGKFTEAHQHLAHARELCRQYLPPEHPMTAQVATLSRAPANPDHLCNGHALPAAPARHAAPPPEPPDPSPSDAPPSFDGAPRPPDSDLAGARAGEPAPVVGPDAGGDPVPPDVAESWWPPPDDGIDPPPNLPVPVGHREQPARRRGPAPLLLAALIAAGLGAVAVIIGLSAVDQQQNRDPDTGPVAAPTLPPTSAPAPTSAPPSPTVSPARPGTPPASVKLVDNRQSITLTWTYPAGAKALVRLSGAPEGQQQRAFQDLPAGSSSYVVHGLDQDTDFCSTGAAVYSAKAMGRAPPACPARAR
ncbi:tetratricopeptide repeat protein [Micromonospora sp. CPCC 205371]|nr:tetratricopeptide repeat protein [Micromonospora sp. CPCC 205371]